MTFGEFLKLNGQLITLEQLEEIENSDFVDGVQFNGLTGNSFYYGRKWYTVYFNNSFINFCSDDVMEISVYI